MQKATPPGRWIEEVQQIYLCWEHYWQFAKNHESQVSGNGLFCFISTRKFGSFKNPLATVTSLSELYFRIKRLILLVQKKKKISMNYGCSTRSWKPWRWMRLDLIFSMRDIHINSNPNPLIKFTSSSSRTTEFKDILPWNIP